jgi:hypothetical protein
MSKFIRYANQVPSSSAVLNRQHPLAQGLIGLWTFDYSGNCHDRVANNNGIPTAVTSGYGSYGVAGTFVNIAAEIKLKATPAMSALTQSFTLAALFNQSASASAFSGLVCRADAFAYSNMSYGLYLLAPPSSVLGFGADQNHFESSMVVTPGKWTFAAGVNTPGGATLYLDNAITTTTAFGAPSSYPLGIPTLGAFLDVSLGGPGGFQGQIAAAYIYKRALTSVEYNWLRSNPFCMFNGPNYLRNVSQPTAGAVPVNTMRGIGSITGPSTIQF